MKTPDTFTNELYLSILNTFKSKDELRKKIANPFVVDDYLVATDAWTMVAIKCPNFGGFKTLDDTGFNETVRNYINRPKGETYSIVGDINAILDKLPKVEVMDDGSKECPCCYGDGEVESEFKHDGKYYHIDHECPVCEGDGEVWESIPSGRFEPDTTNHQIQIGKKLVNPKLLQTIIETSKELGCDKPIITHIDESDNQPISIYAGETIMILMPISVNGQKNAHTIEIKSI